MQDYDKPAQIRHVDSNFGKISIPQFKLGKQLFKYFYVNLSRNIKYYHPHCAPIGWTNKSHALY